MSGSNGTNFRLINIWHDVDALSAAESNFHEMYSKHSPEAALCHSHENNVEEEKVTPLASLSCAIEVNEVFVNWRILCCAHNHGNNHINDTKKHLEASSTLWNDYLIAEHLD